MKTIPATLLLLAIACVAVPASAQQEPCCGPPQPAPHCLQHNSENLDLLYLQGDSSCNQIVVLYPVGPCDNTAWTHYQEGRVSVWVGTCTN